MEVRSLTTADADVIATWRYPDPYSTYDVSEIVTSARGFWAVSDGAELVGYCCFGAEARVPGVGEEEGTLDVGYGMRPDLVGKGSGRTFVGAILDFAVEEFGPQRLRLLILASNRRSRKVAMTLGFEDAGVAQSVEGDFLIVVRPTGS